MPRFALTTAAAAILVFAMRAADSPLSPAVVKLFNEGAARCVGEIPQHEKQKPRDTSGASAQPR